jgi:membrane protein DedA with SNARE-associated domain
MDLTTFAGASQWIMTHGYSLMFLAMLIEGPTITAAAAFAAAVGFFNIYIVFILSIFGDVVADIIYYAIGYWGRFSVVNKFGHRFGLSTLRMGKIEDLLKQHTIKTMIAIKSTPVLAFPGLMLVGAAKMPIGRFILWCFLITLPKALFFVIIGYYFGYMYNTISRYVENGSLIILVFAVSIFVIYMIYKKVSASLAEKIEKI